MLKKVINSIKQYLRFEQQKPAPQKKEKNARGKKQYSISILRKNQVVKPTLHESIAVIAPRCYEISKQAAKSILRSRDYVHVPPSDTHVPNGGDL